MFAAAAAAKAAQKYGSNGSMWDQVTEQTANSNNTVIEEVVRPQFHLVIHLFIVCLLIVYRKQLNPSHNHTKAQM